MTTTRGRDGFCLGRLARALAIVERDALVFPIELQVSNNTCSKAGVGTDRETVGTCPGGGFTLVSEEEVDIREDLVELDLEELANERRRQVQRERLFPTRSIPQRIPKPEQRTLPFPAAFFATSNALSTP